MTSFERFENRLPALLDELAVPQLPDYADDLFARTAATRQRAGWTFPERWLLMSSITQRLAAAPNIPWRLGALVALLVVAALVGLLIAGTQQRNLPAPFGPAANGVIPYVSNGDIYIGDLAKGTSRILVESPADDVAPQFSPDGTRVVFYRVEHVAGRLSINVYVVRPDGSDLRQITPESILDADRRLIAWTPDGRHIALVHSVNGVNQLDLLDASGNEPAERIAAAAGLDSLQFRPPDSREMLFRACANVTTNCGLYVMDADGTNVRLLVGPATAGDTLDLTGAVYTADGGRILYNRWTLDASVGAEGCCQLFVMNADGTNQHLFIPNTGGAWDGQAVVSPDGTRVAFWHNDKPTHGISVIRTDGTGEIVDTGPPLSSTAHWVWAPDSSKILMYPNDASRTSAYLLDPDGGAWKTVPWVSDGDLDWQRVAP